MGNIIAGRWSWADGTISGHVCGDLAVMAFLEFCIIFKGGSNRSRERKSKGKEWMALHLEDLLNE